MTAGRYTFTAEHGTRFTKRIEVLQANGLPKPLTDYEVLAVVGRGFREGTGTSMGAEIVDEANGLIDIAFDVDLPIGNHVFNVHLVAPGETRPGEALMRGDFIVIGRVTVAT